ncbi:Ras GTPase [Arthrobotrys conoides]|uniref:Ras GTPase n=1 Tax=Arthrobotrys conoides TaxID=74498 RepID=A0AAN8RLA7_9PEZI
MVIDKTVVDPVLSTIAHIKYFIKQRKREKEGNENSTASSSDHHMSSSVNSEPTRQQFLREYKLLLLGPPGSGKWCFIIKLMGYRSCFLDFDEMYSRVEDSHRKQCVIDDEVALLDVWPIYENNTLEPYPGFVDHADGFILMYSIASRKSFEEVSVIYQQIQKAKGGFSCNILLAGNKCDLETEREVSTEEGRALAHSFGAIFFEISAKAHINIDSSVHELVRRIRRPDRPREVRKENDQGERLEATGGRGSSFRAASARIVNHFVKRDN